MKGNVSIQRVLLVGFLLTALSLGAQTRRAFVDFSDRAGWNKGKDFITPEVSEGRNSFLLRFRSSEERIVARKNGLWDLSADTSIRFRVGIDQTNPLLESTLSLKSGNGWYRTTFTLSETGTHHLLRPLSEFRSEGSPAGWNRIDAVEWSFWPRTPGAVKLHLLGLEAFQDQIWILDPEPLAQNGDDRYTARVTRRHHQRILEGLGLPYAMVPITGPFPRHTPSLVILPSGSTLPSTITQHLQNWSKAGATLIVFGSKDNALAKWMSVHLGGKVSSTSVGEFDRMTPASSTQPSVFQHAWGFTQIRPATGGTVFATWSDARGKEYREPAVITSPRGVWVSAEWKSGDVIAKQEWIGGWLAMYQKHLLEESIRYHREVLGPGILASEQPTQLPAQRLKKQASILFQTAARERDPGLAFQRMRQAVGLNHRSNAADTTVWDAEIRGIWDQQGTGFYAGGWDETARQLKAAGFNAIFANMATAGRAHYRSSLVPPSKTLEKYGDQLLVFSQAAERHGLQAHAWKICWKLNTRDAAFQQNLERQGRLMQDAQGNTIPWLAFSDPRNIQFEIESLLEMARSAPLAGIHLDYMRYPGREADYGPAARKAFEMQLGRRLPNWPHEVLGPLKDRYQEFRQQEVHRAMAQISRAVKREFPDLTLSVAVWGAWPDCADAQGQDWPVWCKNRWVDLIIPMNYTDNRDQFAGWLDLQRRQPGVAERLVPGIGLISTNAELSTSQLLDQMDMIRERNLPGAILYRLDTSLPKRVFPSLRIWP